MGARLRDRLDDARALLGKRKKDVVEVSTPGGGKSYEIIKVEFK